jgi:hypothetical protein
LARPITSGLGSPGRPSCSYAPSPDTPMPVWQQVSSRFSRPGAARPCLGRAGTRPAGGPRRIRPVQHLITTGRSRPSATAAAKVSSTARDGRTTPCRGEVAVDGELQVAGQLHDRGHSATLPDHRETGRQRPGADQIRDHAPPLGQLHHQAAHPTGGAVDQQPLARPGVQPPHPALPARRRRPSRCRAPEQTPHRITGRPACSAVADRLDAPGQLVADHIGRAHPGQPGSARLPASTGFTPTASTATTTWPRPGRGAGSWRRRMASGPPGWSTTSARITLDSGIRRLGGARPFACGHGERAHY